MTDSTEPEDEAQGAEVPEDPAAPRRFTLPSGKVVEVISARTLRGADMREVRAAQPGSGYVANVTAMRAAFIQRMVTEIEPGRRSKTPLDGTAEALDAQEPDDWTALFMLGPVSDAMGLVLGTSVIPDFEAFADPKAPTTAS